MITNISDYGFELQKHNTNIVYTQGDRTVSFQQMHSLTYSLAKYLQLILKPGDKIILSMDDSPEVAMYWHACVISGIIPIMVNTKLSVDDIKNIAHVNQCQGIAANSDMLPNYPNIKILLSKEIVADLPTATREDVYIHQYQPDEDLAYFMTGGTVIAKTVAYQHQGLASFVKQPQPNIWQFDSNTKLFCPGRMTHGLGACLNIITPWIFGSSHVLSTTTLDLKKLPELVNQHQITHMILLPFALNLLLVRPKTKFGNSLKVLIAAGEPLPPSVAREMREVYGIPVRNWLGLTEGFTVLINDDPDKNGLVSLGKPFPGTTIKLINDQGNECGVDEPGRMIVHTPVLAARYHNDKENTEATFKNGWYHSSDILVRDERGCYFFVGRDNQCVKIRGVWTSATEVEAMVSKAPGVTDCVASFTTNQEGFTEAVAFVVRDPDSTINAIDIKTHVAKNTNVGTLIPKQVYFVDSVPLTLNLKKVRSFDKLMDHARKNDLTNSLV